MTNVRTAWILAACWFAAALLAFLALDASSTRSWVYLAVIALGPPVALLRLWPETRRQTADDVIHGRDGRS